MNTLGTQAIDNATSRIHNLDYSIVALANMAEVTPKNFARALVDSVGNANYLSGVLAELIAVEVELAEKKLAEKKA